MNFGRQLHTFFFAPAAPTDLGACRVVVCGLLFAFYLPVDFAGVVTFRDAWMPITVFRITGVAPLPHELLSVAAWLWKLSLFFLAIGLWTRVVGWAAFFGGLYLLGLPHNFGKTDHYDALVVFVLGILAFSRCGDALSIDGLLRRRRGSSAIASGEYRWPIRAVWIVFATIFFSSGYSKVVNGGPAWVFGDHLSVTLLKAQYSGEPLVDWGAWIANTAPLPQILAGMTLLLELCYPLAVFSRRARVVVVPGMFAAQIGIRLLMGPAFWPFLICNAFWVPWSRIWPRGRSSDDVVRRADH